MDHNQNYQSNKEDELHLNLSRQYLPYWPLFLLVILLSIAAGYFYLRYTMPVYEVNAKIMVKDEKKGLNESEVLDALNLFAEKKIVENEIDILRSWPLLETVIKDLGIYSVQWHDGKILDKELYGPTAPLVFTALNADSVVSSEKIPFTIDWKAKKVIFPDQVVAFGSTFNFAGRPFRLEANPGYTTSEESPHFFLQTINPFSLAKRLQNGLDIASTSKQSSMINVSYKTAVPKKAEAIINRLFIVYKNASLQDKNQVAQNTLNFVDDRLELVTRQLDSVEKNIEQYKTTAGIVDMSAQGQLFLESMRETDSKLSEINIQLGVLDDIEQYVLGKGPSPGTVPSVIGINDPTLIQLLQKLYDLDLQYSRLSAVTGEQNDQLVQIRDQMAQLRPSLMENIRNVRKNLTITRNRMNGQASQTNALLRTIPQKEKALLEISRQQAIKNNIYTFLLQKREETALSYASAVADSRIVESARRTEFPISPVAKYVYGVAILLGLLISILIIAIKEQFNNKVLFTKDVKTLTNIPLIGEVSYQAGSGEFVIQEGVRTIIAEQVRSIRSNLSYFGINERERKVIMVTSSFPGEGKSFISSNLAISLTLTGKKVVLMELDLRKPKLSYNFGMETDKGISNYVVGKVEIEEIIRRSSFEGLFLIPSGPIPPNPTELLLLPRFEELMNELRNHFDYIIMDTPPVGLVSDAQLLARYADASIFIVRHNVTPKSALLDLKELYEEQKYKNMSIVFNGLKPRGISIYGKGYGQVYGYGRSRTTYGYKNGYYESKENGRKKNKLRQKL